MENTISHLKTDKTKDDWLINTYNYVKVKESVDLVYQAIIMRPVITGRKKDVKTRVKWGLLTCVDN